MFVYLLTGFKSRYKSCLQFSTKNKNFRTKSKLFNCISKCALLSDFRYIYIRDNGLINWKYMCILIICPVTRLHFNFLPNMLGHFPIIRSPERPNEFMRNTNKNQPINRKRLAWYSKCIQLPLQLLLVSSILYIYVVILDFPEFGACANNSLDLDPDILA